MSRAVPQVPREGAPLALPTGLTLRQAATDAFYTAGTPAAAVAVAIALAGAIALAPNAIRGPPESASVPGQPIQRR